MIAKLVFLAGLLPLALAQNPSVCYSQGYDQAALCQPFVGTFCDRVDPEELHFLDANRRCFNLANGNRCDFSVYNTGLEGASPSDTNCKTVLAAITSGCTRGGHGQFGAGPSGYTFTVNPNVGPCTADIGADL